MRALDVAVRRVLNRLSAGLDLLTAGATVVILTDLLRSEELCDHSSSTEFGCIVGVEPGDGRFASGNEPDVRLLDGDGSLTLCFQAVGLGDSGCVVKEHSLVFVMTVDEWDGSLPNIVANKPRILRYTSAASELVEMPAQTCVAW